MSDPAVPLAPGEAPDSDPAAANRDFEIHLNGNRFGELLLRKQFVGRTALVEALLQQTNEGKRLGTLLVDAGAMTDRQLAESLSEHLTVALADLRKDRPDPRAVEMLPEHVAREWTAVPLRFDGDTLEIVIADPTPDATRILEAATDRKVLLLVAPASEIRRVIDTTYRAMGAIDAQVTAFSLGDKAKRSAAAPAHVQAAPTGADAPVIQVVNLLIAQALRDRASDIHIEPQDKQLRVRFRVDGALHDVTNLPTEMAPALVSRIKIMAGMNIVERRRPQDGQTSLEIDGRGLDVRVASTPTVFGEKVTLRLLDKSRPLFRAAELGMPADTHEAFEKLVRSPFGMVVCVGPTGSGKTTTLYATLSELNSSERNIMTIEDPVEYVLPSINQIQINEIAGVTFADGLRSILRQDPDVILVGEIRDPETARIAVQSALTGHLVLTSLHATDTASAVHRFLDMGIEAFLVASSMVAVVGQRLIRRICGSCKTRRTPTEDELSFWLEAGGLKAFPNKDEFWAGEGCNFCSGTGYEDRVGVYELLRITPEIKRLIVGWATVEEIRRMAMSQGMRTLLEEGLAAVNNDVTTIAEIIRVIYAS